MWLCVLFARTSPVAAQAARSCGTERWPVKILADRDTGLIDFTPRLTSIRTLAALPIPEVAYPFDRRLPPHELRVYRVRARAVRLLSEADGDLHVVLQDPLDPHVTMIAEVPSAFCAVGTAYGPSFDDIRRVLRALPRDAVLDVDGVAFYDFIHNQAGRARNGIELHPVLRVAPVP